MATVLELLGDRKAHARRDLLGLPKILVRRLLETLPLERDDALISALLGSLIDRHGEIAGADQLSGPGVIRQHGIQAILIEACGGAKTVGRVKIHNDHFDRAIGLGLELETSLEFERRTQQHRQRRGLAQNP